MNAPEDPVITYTVRDLLVRIETKLDGKADKADLNELRKQVDQQQADADDLKMWRAKVVGLALGAGVGGGGALTALIRAFGG